MTLTLKLPPPTTVEPVTELLHGIEVTDPYRWLEDQNSPRTRRWLEEQAAYTRVYLNLLPGRDRIEKRVRELVDVERMYPPIRVGNRYFFSKRVRGLEQPTIVMREGMTGGDVLLVDPAQLAGRDNISVRILGISADGCLLAYGVRHGGDDCESVEILDVDRRCVLPDRLPRGLFRGLVFALDRSGFYYSHRIVETMRPRHQAVYWHAFGTTFEDDKEIFAAGDDPRLTFSITSSRDGQRMGLLSSYGLDRYTTSFSVKDLTPSDAPPQCIVEKLEDVFSPAFVGNQLYAFTRLNAPKGRIVIVSRDRPQPEHWSDVIPESDRDLLSFRVTKNRIVASYLDNCTTRAEVFDLNGRRLNEIPLPAQGTVQLFSSSETDNWMIYSFTSFCHPPSIYCFDAQSGEHKVWSHPQVAFDASSIAVKQVSFVSKDGTSVPMFIVGLKGNLCSKTCPTFLTAYGGFGSSVTPQFTVFSTFLIEHGCILAVPNIRGGSEFGEEWHQAARRRNRQNAIDDFIAAAEWLLAEGYAAPGKLAIGGGSNAGLLVGAAMTQRPDLFRVVICLGPLLDMLRYHRFDLARRWVAEYGSAEDPDDFPHLLAYSPYHKVRDGGSYPAMLVISGDADMRCNPLHARKMVARLQAANGSGNPILLDYKSNWGHSPAQPLTKRIEALTDRLAFTCHQLGIGI